MGRKSREKRERDRRPLAREVQRWSAESLYALLDAASVSPTASHRGPSIATIFHAAVRRRRQATRPVPAALLPTLVDAAGDETPSISTLEDFQPYDVRAEVLGRWGPELFRLVPGSLERPPAVIRQHALIARAIDDTLVSEVGFGLRDIGQIVLRRLDAVANVLAPLWPDGPAPAVGDDPSISEAEVIAALSLPSPSTIADACTDGDRARAAVARFVVGASELSCDLSHPVATFGPVIAVDDGQRSVWLPAGSLVEALPAIGAQLSAYAARRNARSNEIFAGTVGNHVGRLFQGLGQQITGPVRVGSGPPIHSLVTFNDRQVLALDVAAGLTPLTIQNRLAEGAKALQSIRPGVEIRNPETSWRLQTDAKMVRIQVIAGPMHAKPLESSGPTMTVEDLEWILYSSQRSPEDLWYFVRDLVDPHGIGHTFAWDLIDRWEVWKPQKNFYRGGAAITSLMFSPHAAVAEWREAEAAAPLEVALHQLGLPPVHSWPVVVLDHRSGSEVGDVRTDRVYQVMSWRVPVAISKLDSHDPSADSSTLWSLAVGLAWKLAHSVEAFLAAADASGHSSLRIEFEHQERSSGAPLSAERVDGGVLTIGWDDRLQQALAQDSFAVESCCGEVVAHAFEAGARADFVAAWEAAPPGVRIDGFSVGQRVQRLPEPLDVHDAVRSDALRQLGEHLAGVEVEPALLEGAAATKFESHTVFRWLVDRFHRSIAHLDFDCLIVFAMAQLEHSSHHRFMLDKRLGWEQGFPVKGGDDTAERREQMTLSTRVICFMIEEVLAHPPEGDVGVDDLAWIEALSIAELCIESCVRSDAIHFQLTRAAIEISDLYEVNVVHTDEVTDVDVAAYNRLRSAHMRPSAVPISRNQHINEDSGEEEPRPVVELMPELVEIDAAMRSDLGFGIDALIGVLNVATQYDATPDAPATSTSFDAFVAECVELVVGARPDEFEAALAWLSLRGADLSADVIPHWEVERRAKRTATCPFISTAGQIWVLPWSAGSTLQIVANYLGDGRLPWPDAALPQNVRTALNHYRQGRNRALEKDCVAALSAHGLVVRGGIKPERAHLYGIERLAGEIDALCVDDSRSRIWVIEAKDPYTPYSARQIRRLVDDFLAPGKYVDRLLRKVADIEATAGAVAASLGASGSDRGWTVMGLMVTRHLEPAAFALEPTVAFCVVDDIAEVIDRDELAAPGLQLQTDVTAGQTRV